MTTPAPFPYTQHTLIRASAGAGKTHSLSSQFIALLYQGASPSSILATTFTRKAAGEILGKVLIRLAEAATDQTKAAELASAIKVPQLDRGAALALLRTVSLELHRVSVSTLDAFFSRLAGSFKLELDLPLDPAMVASTDPQARQARAEGIEAMLAASEPSVMVDMLKRVHHDHVNRSVTGAIDMIVSKLHELYRTSPEKAVWSALELPPTLEDDTLEYAIEQLESLLATDLSKRYLKTLADSLDAARQGDWESFLGKGIPKLLAEGKTEYYKQPVPEAVIEGITPLFIHAKADRIGRIVTQTLATWELLQHFDKQYDAIRRARRLLTFSDLPLKLARELAPTSDIDSPGLDAIYYRLDGQVQHLLLDEFQDTSPLQWQVLKPIAQEIVNHLDQSRSFFCVGDVKQSIYSWRGGCAELFDQLTDDLELKDKNKHELQKSYRTSQDVLDVVNHIFSDIIHIPPVRDSKSNIVADVIQKLHDGFKPHSAARDMPGYVKLVTSSIPVDIDADNPDGDYSDPDEFAQNQLDAQIDGEQQRTGDEPHASFVASYIANLVHTHPTRDIGVLVRTNAMVGRLIHLLQKQNINASGEGGNPVTDDAAVELILSALQLADHPGDSVARYHVQRSPLASIINLRDLSPEALEDFSHHLRDAIAKQGFAQIVNQWSSQLALHGNVRSATRLSQLVELAQDFDRQPGSRPGEFVEFVKATPVEEPNPATVRVMTVHKAKGLEFDIVVLPELHGKMGIASRELTMIYRHHPTKEPAAIYRYANAKVRALSQELTEAYEQEERRRLTDDLGAFYVALTRPRQALHMIIPPLGLTSKGNLKAVGRTDLSPASLLRNILAADVDEQPELDQVLFTQGDEDWDPHAIDLSTQKQPGVTSDTSDTSADDQNQDAIAPLLKIDLPQTASPSRSWRVVAPSNLEADQRVAVSDLLRTVSADGRSYGSLMHAMFEQLEFLSPASLVDSALDKITRQAKRKTPQANSDQLNSARLAFARLIATPAIVNAMAQPPLLADQGKLELWRERAFAVRIEDALVNGVLDRAVIQRDSAGRALAATIVDFKTDRLADDVDHAQAVAAIVARYRPQLMAYRKALASMLKLPAEAIDAQLLLLGIGEVAKVF